MMQALTYFISKYKKLTKNKENIIVLLSCTVKKEKLNFKHCHIAITISDVFLRHTFDLHAEGFHADSEAVFPG